MEKRLRGFTILELMVAILLFAMVSTASYKLFNAASKAQQVTSGIFDDLDIIQRVKVILEKDLFQLAPRPIRDEFGDRQPAVLSPSKSGAMLEFTREGWRNPLKEKRSTLQRVSYDLVGGDLIRSYWVMLDRAPDPVKIDQVLLTNIDSVKLRFRDEKQRWHSTWPPVKQSSETRPEFAVGRKYGFRDNVTAKDNKVEKPVMPQAIEMKLSHRNFGNIYNVFPLLDYNHPELQSQGFQKKNHNQGSRLFRQRRGSSGYNYDEESEYINDEESEEYYE